MFKILLLEVWYNLSDRAVEERINDSITIEVADDREDYLSEKENIKEEKYMSTLCSGKPGVDKEGRWVKRVMQQSQV